MPLPKAHPTALIDIDPWLGPYGPALTDRYNRFHHKYEELLYRNSLNHISTGHQYFGLNPGQQGKAHGIWYREWAPGAKSLALIGDFNKWDRQSHPLEKDQYGIWSIFIPQDSSAGKRLTHDSKVKVHVITDHTAYDRLPAYIRKVSQKPDHSFVGHYWNPPKYQWQHRSPNLKSGLRIYEAHIGMSTQKTGITTYQEFTDQVLPRIHSQGYNAIQLMAIQQHPYYASFGYQVSNFFAPSHYFGEPGDLQHLIDTAHRLGIVVLLDVVHSHAIKNIHEGLNELDGTDHQYFHAGSRGEHPDWGTKRFDYSKYEVLRFLLSNLRYWMEEFHFDGFRFDGVNSMLYLDQGHRAFDHYDHYFDPHNVDNDAVTYLQMANTLIHQLNPQSITIAEEVSGMPGLARPVEEGGIGFDYRLAMGLPDYWIKLLKDTRDEDWNLAQMFDTLTNRRRGEKHVAYAESHDQALVGDKTIAFWLMDKDMYKYMSIQYHNAVIDRGIALHKMIRLITFTLGGEGWLNFIGNEFGHPEWVDFPREGNDNSYHYARRQWNLADDPNLKYQYLNNFDQALQQLEDKHKIIQDDFIQRLSVHEDRKTLTFRRGALVFAFNFHPSQSYPDLTIGVPDPSDYKLYLNTDAPEYGGQGHVKTNQRYPIQSQPWDDQPQSLSIYLPARTAQVLVPMKHNK